MDPLPASKKPKVDRSTDLLNIPNKATSYASRVLLVNEKPPHIYKVAESKSAAAVKQFLNNTSATQQDQSTNELNAEVVSEGESYIEMTLGLVPLEEEYEDEVSDTSDTESSETSCEELKLPDGRCLQSTEDINNSKFLIEELENK